MSTDYKIVSATDEAAGIGGELSVLEHSGMFDLDVNPNRLQPGVETAITVGHNLSVEQLAEAGLEILKVALYNCADVDALRKWLHARVNEVDCSGSRTTFPE